MDAQELRNSLAGELPPGGLPPLAALWWVQKGSGRWRTTWWTSSKPPRGWLSTLTCIARRVRPQNADYWYERAGRKFQRESLDDEWEALVEGLSGK